MIGLEEKIDGDYHSYSRSLSDKVKPTQSLEYTVPLIFTIMSTLFMFIGFIVDKEVTIFMLIVVIITAFMFALFTAQSLISVKS